MFDTPQRQAPPAAGVEPDADGVQAWQRQLSTGIEAISADTGPAELVALLRACEELKNTAEAAQAAATVALDAAERSRAAAAGVPAARQGRGVAAQVGMARRVSHHRAARLLGLAKVADELPCASRAFRSGLLSEWRMTLLARETAAVSAEHRREIDRRVAGDPDRVARLGDRELVAEARRLAMRLDAGAVAKRRRRAESERNVTCRPAPDSMTYLTGHLPVAQGVAVHVALGKQADALKAGGDPRSRGQIMADTLVDRVLHPGASTDDYDPTRWDATPPETDGSSSAAPVRINLVMTDHTLLQQGTEPGWLEGHGPIPADLARELATTGSERGAASFLRRLYTDPATGQLVAMESTQRTFPKALADLIRLRDADRCRMPWCDAPIRHTDHARPREDGGKTSYANGQGLCQACNHAKQATGWRVRPVRGPDGPHTVEVTTPTGHTYTSGAPAAPHDRAARWQVDLVHPLVA